MDRGRYDLVIIGNYTKDTIESPAGTRNVDGGGFNYGCHVAAMMGLKTAAVTRLAREDDHVVRALETLGIDVYPEYTPQSTRMHLYYPNTNPDERTLTVNGTAGAFTPAQVAPLEAKAFLINASARGEVPLPVIEVLREKQTLIVADAQGFVRIIGEGGTLLFDRWPEKEIFLSKIDVLKADIVEGETLTGEKDLRAQAGALAALGPKEIVLTHRDGVLVYAGGDFFEATFRPREMVGRSGRGDTCISSYMGRRLSAGPAEATVWAAAVTSLKMEAEGPILRKTEEVEALIEGSYRAAP